MDNLNEGCFSFSLNSYFRKKSRLNKRTWYFPYLTILVSYDLVAEKLPEPSIFWKLLLIIAVELGYNIYALSYYSDLVFVMVSRVIWK